MQDLIKNLKKFNQNPSSEGCLDNVIEMLENRTEEMEGKENANVHH